MRYAVAALVIIAALFGAAWHVTGQQLDSISIGTPR